MNIFKRIIVLITFLLLTLFTSCNNLNKGIDVIVTDYYVEDKVNNIKVYKDNKYNDNAHVALYLVGFKQLPTNYYNRQDFASMRDEFNKENLITCFGGVFQNREKRLPLDDKYYECDVNYEGYSRGKYRLVYNFSYNIVYYTEDHYDSFVRVYKDYMYDGVTLYS